MPRKTFLFVSQYTGSRYHGMNYRSYYLAKALVNKGHRAIIMSASYSHLYTKLPHTTGRYTFENIDGIEYVWVKTNRYNGSYSLGRIAGLFVFLFQLLRFPIEKISRPDVVVLSSFSLTPLRAVLKWVKHWNSKFFFEVRDLWPLTILNLGKASKYHPFVMYLQHLENKALQRADKVISVLPNTAPYFEKHGMSSEKFIHIPNGVDLAEYAVPIANKRVSKKELVIGYAGSISKGDAIEYLIRACSQVRDLPIEVIVVGKGPEKQRMKTLVGKLGLENISFRDPIAKSEIPTLLASFDVCFIGWFNEPIYHYGISANKLFDYMIAGKPVIHSVNSPNEPVAISGCGLVVEPENEDQIASAIRQLYSMSAIDRINMGEKGQKYVRKYHDYSSLSQKLLDLSDQ